MGSKKREKKSKKSDKPNAQENMQEHPEFAYTLVDNADQMEDEGVEDEVEVPQGPSKIQASWAGRLASNDINVRTKTLGALEAHLADAENEVSHLDLMKIWKGLFYALWAADGVQVQNDLSDRLANLMHVHPTVDRMVQCLHACLKIMDGEWDGIDELRMDKYYYFIRRLINQLFEYIKNNNYEASVIDAILTTIQDDIFSSSAESMLSTHVCDVYLDELQKVYGEENEISDEIWVRLGLELFVKVLVSSDSLAPALLERIDQYIRDLCKAATNYDDDLDDVDNMLTVYPLAPSADYLFKAATTKEEILSRHRSMLFKLNNIYKNSVGRQANLRAAEAERLAADEEEADIEREALELLEKEEAQGVFLSKAQRKKRGIKQTPEELIALAHPSINGESEAQNANPDKKRKNKKQKVAPVEVAPVEPAPAEETPAEATNGKRKRNKKAKQQEAEVQPPFVPVKEEPKDEPESVLASKKKKRNKKQKTTDAESVTAPTQPTKTTTTTKTTPTPTPDVVVADAKGAKKNKKVNGKPKPVVEDDEVQINTDSVEIEEPEPVVELPVKKRSKLALNGNTKKVIKTRSLSKKLQQEEEAEEATKTKTQTKTNTTTDNNTDATPQKDEANFVTPTTTPHKAERKTPKSLLKTPNNGSSSKKNVRFSVENSVKEFFKESTIGLGTKLTF